MLTIPSPGVLAFRSRAVRRGCAGALLAGLLLLTGCSQAGDAPRSYGVCGEQVTPVGATAAELQAALDQARPGDTLALQPITYVGTFTIAASGAEGAPITLCGADGSRIDGGDVAEGYGLHLNAASFWRIQGVEVTAVAKGIVLDAAHHNEIVNVVVDEVGQEGIHLRSNSSDNAVLDSVVSNTGLTDPEFGEGVYVGSAESNWCRYTDCAPDASDRNRIEGNAISDVSAEAIDVKEGTTGGSIIGNMLSLSSDPGVDSVIDIKGNEWTIAENTVTHHEQLGMQVHEILEGWGVRNTISANVFDAGAGQVSVEIVGKAREGANTVGCDNATMSGDSVLSNVTCSSLRRSCPSCPFP
ncbi:hypothetical protein BKA24_000855 [Microbacterium marinum]|uniref:Periplasmic copper-binding protein NosD beta helix domain-containing protein n=1 Tax=Microbacterium marinum TaxID=421115 RepID=A0A7W7BNZ1_9MICO|nr:NosD domain-containing protein [Microbacterium marinum]MBB4666146.1 hypothetical protein [Microbacterium marinum]